MRILSLIASATLMFSLSAQANTVTGVITQERQAAKTPEIVLQKLKDGNERFLSGNMLNRDLRAQMLKASDKQYPMAIVLSCIDSRTPPEILFDQGIGDMFVTRTAGNVVNSDILGGLEFATKVSGAKLIVVLGHTNCGAVKGACENVRLGHLTQLLSKIKPAVAQVIRNDGKKSCNDSSYINHITDANVAMVVKQIQKDSPIIASMIKDNQVQVVGAVQDLTTGKINFV
jgi:carbonic anhydrase